MKHYKINPQTVGVYTSNGKYLTDKEKSYSEAHWKGDKAAELVKRGFLIEDINPQPKVKAKKPEQPVVETPEEQSGEESQEPPKEEAKKKK